MTVLPGTGKCLGTMARLCLCGICRTRQRKLVIAVPIKYGAFPTRPAR